MTVLTVDGAAATLAAFGTEYRCRIGRTGTIPAADKREGDGRTPIGRWPIRAILIRADRVAAPALRVPWRRIRPDDGWSDEPMDPAYNRPIRHPHPYSAERLWREDALYDVVVILGHNDLPPVAGLGSAIFLHCSNAEQPTEGCIALPRASLLALLPRLAPGDVVEIG